MQLKAKNMSNIFAIHLHYVFACCKSVKIERTLLVNWKEIWNIWNFSKFACCKFFFGAQDSEVEVERAKFEVEKAEFFVIRGIMTNVQEKKTAMKRSNFL